MLIVCYRRIKIGCITLLSCFLLCFPLFCTRKPDGFLGDVRSSVPPFRCAEQRSTNAWQRYCFLVRYANFVAEIRENMREWHSSSVISERYRGQKRQKPIRSCLLVCGKRGIRTPGPVKVNGFQDRRDRPLRHLSFVGTDCAPEFALQIICSVCPSSEFIKSECKGTAFFWNLQIYIAFLWFFSCLFAGIIFFT